MKSSSGPIRSTLVAKLVRHFDEPFGDSSAIPTFMVSEFAAQHVKVVLTGDGGDELFAGYESFFDIQRLRKLDRVPLPCAQIALVRRRPAAVFGLRKKLSAHDQPADRAWSATSKTIRRTFCFSRLANTGLDAARRCRLSRRAHWRTACCRTARTSSRRRSISKRPRSSPATCW